MLFREGYKYTRRQQADTIFLCKYVSPTRNVVLYDEKNGIEYFVYTPELDNNWIEWFNIQNFKVTKVKYDPITGKVHSV